MAKGMYLILLIPVRKGPEEDALGFPLKGTAGRVAAAWEEDNAH